MEWQYDYRGECIPYPAATSIFLETLYSDWRAKQEPPDKSLQTLPGNQYQIDFQRMVQKTLSHPIGTDRKVRRCKTFRVAISKLKGQLATQGHILQQSEIKIQQQEAKLQQQASKKRALKQELAQVQQDLDLMQQHLYGEVQARLSSLPSEPLFEVDEELAESTAMFLFLERYLVRAVTSHRQAIGSKEWCSAPRLEVVSIRSICTQSLLKEYALFRSRVQSELSEGCQDLPGIQGPAAWSSRASCNEFFLLHGASAEIVASITRSGFDPQRGGESCGRMFGVGAYFADLASKSDRYALPDSNGIRTIIVARVLLGNCFPAFEALPDLRRAPDGYHCICGITRAEGGSVDHREYVVYKGQQALPLFAVQYKHEPDCACATCSS